MAVGRNGAPDVRPSALIIEDDADIICLFEAILNHHGYRTEVVDNGSMVKKVLENSPADLVLVDANLALVDGFQIARMIRSTASWSQVPILMITFKTNEREMAAGKELGVDDYLVKPFDIKDLMRRIGRIREVRKK